MKKGFTLIELLAVIAILAIILLIAVPMVLNVIADSRDKSLKSSAMLIWGAAEQCIAMNEIDATMCTVPATGAASGFTNDADTTLTASNALSSMSSFGGEYVVTFDADATTIASVKVSNGDIASARWLQITGKDGSGETTGN